MFENQLKICILLIKLYFFCRTLESDNKQKEKIQTSGGSVKPRLKKSVVDVKKGNAKVKTKKQEESDALEEGPINPDVEFILRVKSSKPDLSKKVM